MKTYGIAMSNVKYRQEGDVRVITSAKIEYIFVNSTILNSTPKCYSQNMRQMQIIDKNLDILEKADSALIWYELSEYHRLQVYYRRNTIIVEVFKPPKMVNKPDSDDTYETQYEQLVYGPSNHNKARQAIAHWFDEHMNGEIEELKYD